MAETLESRILLTSDFGDAPLPYPTLLAEEGAWHAATGPILGSTRDSESDGTHSVDADGDGSDEDGVTFDTIQTGDLTASVSVNVQGTSARLDAWIDFNSDGNWTGTGEQIFASQPVSAGENFLSFAVPSTAVSGTTYARFRLSSAGRLGTGGPADDGEVEDYLVTITPPDATAGFFTGVTNIPTGTFPDVFAADVDGDGDMDMLTASWQDDTVTWQENDGSQNFQEHTITNTADGPRRVSAADVDGDGDMDVLSASSEDSTVAWYENNGAQNFTKHVIHTHATLQVFNVTAADVDGDGDVDVLSSTSDFVFWYENNGTQNFTPHGIGYTAAFRDGAIIPADVDSDGDLDILATSDGWGKLLWFENNGTQNFTRHEINTQNYGNISNLSATDIDDDGDIDVVGAFWATRKVKWYENDGLGNFTEHDIAYRVNTFLSQPYGLFTADVDGDSDMDVLVADSRNETPTWSWLQNDGAQNFQEQIISSAPMASGYEIVAADVDSDGDLDVLSSYSDQVTWFENLQLDLEFSPGTASEDGGTVQGTATRLTSRLDEPLTVNLSSSDATEATGPAVVTIPSGEMSTDFTLSAIDDPLHDGTQTVTITASAVGYPKEQATVQILDEEIPLEMISPSGVTDDMTPELTWNSVGGADQYELWIKDLKTKQRINDDTALSGTSFTPTVPLNGTNYRVWVRAISISGEVGPWSSNDFRFSVRNAPQITEPSVYRTRDSEVTLEWDPIPDTQWGTPETFEVWIKRHASKYSEIIGIPGPNSYTTESLAMGRYNFWVRAILTGGLESGWSRAREVIVVTPPTVNGPTGTLATLTPKITWDALPGASTYEVYLRNITDVFFRGRGSATESEGNCNDLLDSHAEPDSRTLLPCVGASLR